VPAACQSVGTIEVFAERPIEFPPGAMRLAGRLTVLDDDPLDWRYQLKAWRLKGVPRRKLLAASSLPQLAAALRARFTAEETAKLLGGNYRRVFETSLG
jgi:hypothetical protein